MLKGSVAEDEEDGMKCSRGRMAEGHCRTSTALETTRAMQIRKQLDLSVNRVNYLNKDHRQHQRKRTTRQLNLACIASQERVAPHIQKLTQTKHPQRHHRTKRG